MQPATFSGTFDAERPKGVGVRELTASIRQCLLVGLVTCALTLLSLTLTRQSGGPPAMWSANAFVMVCLLRNARRRWPAVLASAAVGLAAASAFLSPIGITVAATVSDMVEITVFAAGLRLACGRRIDLSRPRTLATFVIMTAAGPALSAALMAGLLAPGPAAATSSRLAVWFCAHALGILVVAPVLLALRPRVLKRIAGRPVDIAVLAGFTVVLFGLFSQSVLPPQAAIIAMIVLITFRLEQAGAAISALITAIVAMGFMLAAAASHRVGGDFATQLLQKQIALAIATSCALAIGAILAQRRRLKTALGLSLAAAEAARAEAVEAARQAKLAGQLAGVGFWRLELATQQVTWSDEMFRIWDMDPSDRAAFDAGMDKVHPEDRELADENFERAMAGRETFHTRPVRLLRPDGSVRHLSGRMGSERNAADEVIAVHGAVVDVTHLRLADEALRSSEARYRMLADHSSDIIIKADKDGVILYVSPSCRRLGYEPQELIGRSRLDLAHPDDLATLAQIRSDLTQGLAPQPPRQLRYLAKDGRWVWLEGEPSIVRDESGEPIEFVSQLRDVTERRAFEMELVEARDAAEAAAKAKSEFLANMSHEIRTPLTSIMGFSGLLAETHDDLSEPSRRYVQRIATASQGLLSIVNDILDFSKLEAGQVELDPHPFDPSAFVEDTVELLGAQAGNKGLTLGLIIDDSVPERIEADSSRLRQVLLNLIGNAIKFTAEGRVSVSMNHTGGPAGHLRVQVADTGPGIPAERRDRLFQRFSQVDGSVSRRHGGTGLGLAICKNLVKLMGGEIGVESELDKGSVFWFTLAAPVAGAEVEAVAETSAVERQAGRILVVDDVNVNRELVRAMLEPFGHSFVEADSGFEAVAAAQREAFDLILMDLQMPGMDGVAAARAIRAGPALNALTPILALSANVLPDHLAACAAAGMDDHIGKPIQPMRLLTKVAEWMHQRHEPLAEDCLSA